MEDANEKSLQEMDSGMVNDSAATNPLLEAYPQNFKKQLKAERVLVEPEKNETTEFFENLGKLANFSSFAMNSYLPKKRKEEEPEFITAPQIQTSNSVATRPLDSSSQNNMGNLNSSTETAAVKPSPNSLISEEGKPVMSAQSNTSSGFFSNSSSTILESAKSDLLFVTNDMSIEDEHIDESDIETIHLQFSTNEKTNARPQIKVKSISDS